MEVRMINFEKAEQLIVENNLEEALLLLDEIDETMASENKVKIHLLKGQIFHKQHKWGDVINQYTEVLEIEPGNSIAKTGIDMAKSILGFYNPDMFNP